MANYFLNPALINSANLGNLNARIGLETVLPTGLNPDRRGNIARCSCQWRQHHSLYSRPIYQITLQNHAGPYPPLLRASGWFQIGKNDIVLFQNFRLAGSLAMANH